MLAFQPLHLGLLIGIASTAVILCILCRCEQLSKRGLRFVLAGGLVILELVRYLHDSFRFPANLPLHLCDITAWVAVWACLTVAPLAVEFLYFAGIGGAGIALLTPEVQSPWPSFGAVRYFAEHGGIVIAAAVLVFGRIAPMRDGAVWRAYWLCALYMACAGVFDGLFGANYFFLCRKPTSPSALDVMGPWPVYLATGVAVGVAVFWLLWLPVKPPRANPISGLLGA